MTVGEKVARWRRAKGLSQRGAARQIGISQPVLRKIEQDNFSRIGLDVADRVVRALKGAVSFDDFVRSQRHA